MRETGSSWGGRLAVAVLLGMCGCRQGQGNPPPGAPDQGRASTPESDARQPAQVDATGGSPVDARSDVAAADGFVGVSDAAARLDGASVISGKVFSPLLGNRLALRLGADQAGGRKFAGDFDRVRLYARALGAAEIAAEAKHQYPVCGSANGCLADWTFDALENGGFPNGAGPGLVARPTGGTVSVVADGAEGGAVRLAGGWVEVQDAPALAVSTAVTYSAWMRASADCPSEIGRTCTTTRLIDKGGWFAVQAVSNGAHSSLTTLVQQAGPFECGSVGYPKAGVWTHYAITFDTNGGIACYVNGVLKRVHTPEGRAFGPLTVDKAPMRFGADDKGFWRVPGQLDHIRVYRRALTAAAMLAHAKRRYDDPCDAGGGCVAEWTFDGPGGLTSTGAASLTAKLVGAAALVDGPEGKAVSLSGGWIEVPDDPALALTEAFSYSVWVMRDPCPPEFPESKNANCYLETLIDKGPWFSLAERADHGAMLSLPGKTFYSSSWPKVGVWTHVGATFDRKDGLRLFIDGKPGGAWLVGQVDNN